MNTVAEMFEALKDGTGLSASFVLPAGVVDPEDLESGTGTSWAWQSWTPTWTNLTVSGSTVTAAYMQIGKTVVYRIRVTLGGGNAPSGSVTFSLPVTSITYPGSANTQIIGNVALHDTGTVVFSAVAVWSTTTTATLNVATAGGTYVQFSGISSTVPHAWANTDEILIQGFYEAA